MSDQRPDSAMKIGASAFLFSAGIVLALMIVSGSLAFVLPAGEYQRTVVDGRTLVVNDSYRTIPAPDYPAWRWFTAPVEVLFAPGNTTLIVIILFLLAVGGSIAVLEGAGVMEELVRRLVARFGGQKYRLIALLVFCFMAVASFIGVYEGMVPMVVFMVPLAVSLGWDSLTGLGISLLPLAFGFASAVTNPFTVAVAQRIADLPLFSGSWLRIIFFLAIYALVTWFVVRYAKKVERDPRASLCWEADAPLRARLAGGAAAAAAPAPSVARRRGRALAWFGAWIGAAMAIVFATARLPGLSDLAFPVMTLFFLVGGIGGGLFAGLGPADVGGFLAKGALNLAPGVVLILMAYSVKHIIVSAKVMDTILYGAASAIDGASPLAAAFLVYAATLVLEFFIGSASAKAFLMMPILTPLADLVGITRQTMVLAYDFGDGFSNMIFPTNALLLIALSFTVVGYPKWMRWTWPLQAAVLAITAGFLAFAVAIRFGPF
jgi:uncharacterized ion transporter superfamily protein YfcC